MTSDYRIESSQPIAGRFWPKAGSMQFEVSDRALAISLAAKSFTRGGEIRVVHVPTGEVVFRKTSEPGEWSREDL
jgi:hypothetical protein